MAPQPLNGATSAALSPVSQPIHPAPTDGHPPSDQLLRSTLSASAHEFLQPTPSLYAASLVLAKRYLDPLATSASEAQERRLQQARKKRKRGESDGYDAGRMLRMKQLHVEGFEIAQIWEQARRILDASRQEIERHLQEIGPNNDGDNVLAGVHRESKSDESDQSSVSDDENKAPGGGVAAEVEDLADQNQNGHHDGNGNDERVFGGSSEGSVTDSNPRLPHEGYPSEVADEAIENGSDDEVEELFEADKRPPERFVADRHGLNDGFFSIDDFNRQSSVLEQKDARGEQEDEDTSEEDIDWATDPFTTAQPRKAPEASSRERGRGEQEEGSKLEEEDGPRSREDGWSTSGSDEENLQGNLGVKNNTNEIKYADFFEPPPRKSIKSDHRRPLSKTQPVVAAPENDDDDDDDDIQRTISVVRRDIFEDDLPPDDESSASDADPSKPSRSNHQIRQAEISAEIRKLEAANVAKRDWTLTGEARAADRPINSLLEEDLEFERTGKPVPVITNEVSEDMEALIKRRILAREFDEVIRRRPGDLATGDLEPGVRRGRFELDDTKPQQSLAEIYEVEHLRTTDPGYVDPKDSKLKAQHDAIDVLWKDVSAKLDALSSLHFKPKPPTAHISVVADVPAITMEDARPTAGGDVGGASMLAPQEIYHVGEGRLKTDKAHEVISKGGSIAAREELTREQKLRRRRREKERIRKAGGVPTGSVRPNGVVSGTGRGAKEKEREREEVMLGLKKGGVKIIGRRGEVRDLNGRDTAVGGGGGGGGNSVKKAGRYKL